MLRTIILLTTLILSSVSKAQMDWTATTDLSDADKSAIIELVREFGLDRPGRASEFPLYQINRKLYVISSLGPAVGLRRVWEEVQVCRSSEDHCRQRSKLTVGDWAIASQIIRQERWLFSEDDMTVEVALGNAISYAEAESIVLAIHHKQLTFVPRLTDYARSFDAQKISRIWTVNPIAREFMVNIDYGGSGSSLSVRLTGDEVLVYAAAKWAE